MKPISKPSIAEVSSINSSWRGCGKQPAKVEIDDVVRRCVAHDLPVVPVYGLNDEGRCRCADGAACSAPGKHPVGGFQEATLDVATVKRWLDSGRFQNVGIRCGTPPDKAGFFVVDVDARNGGLTTIAQWEVENAPLPPTMQARTGGGGMHYYYRLPPGEAFGCSNGKAGPGIDIKADGGFVVAAPSLHLSGNRYEFVEGRGPGEPAGAIGDAPEWLLAKIRAAKRTDRNVVYDTSEIKSAVDSIALTRRIAIAKRLLDAHPVAIADGTGEPTTFEAASIGYGCAVPINDFFPLLQAYGDRCKPPWGFEELQAKIGNAYRYNERPFGWRLVAPIEKDARRVLQLGLYDADNVDQLLNAMAADEKLFVFNQRLVKLVEPAGERARPEPHTAITLQDSSSRVVAWTANDKDGMPKAVKAPRSLFEMAVSRRDSFGAIRVLNGVLEHPFVRPDGSLVTTPGFDPQTGIYLAGQVEFEAGPPNPTHADARAAWQTLRELLSDFPFREEADAAGWLAIALTLIMRPAFKGLAPMALIDATTAGSGKGKSIDIIALLCMGRHMPRLPLSSDQAEQRKLITTQLLAAPEAVLFDNVTGPLGGAVIDLLLTAPIWGDRMLSRNEGVELRNQTLWCATANNAAVSGDTVRRVLRIQLEPEVEQPELRTFKHPDIESHVVANRLPLLRALTTIASAYFHAGAPRSATSARWGSFEGWQGVVAECVVWVTGIDPVSTRKRLVEDDTDGELSSELVSALHELGEQTCAEIAIGIASGEDRWKRLRDVIAELLPTRPGAAPTPVQIGQRLSSMKRRIYKGGLRLVSVRAANRRAWRVESVTRTSGSSK